MNKLYFITPIRHNIYPTQIPAAAGAYDTKLMCIKIQQSAAIGCIFTTKTVRLN